MGKASKWIRNFLLGKKEEKEKDKKRVSSVATESLGSPKATLLVSEEKRRWSFKKLTPAEKITHRNGSFDSIATGHMVKQVLEEHEIEQIRFKAVLITTSKEANGKIPVATAPDTQAIRPLKDAAAIKIQAAFRSYLARKALRALRGLVKLQALVRGHQVRKQTTAVLRSMHALMTIQVRARYQRVQMVEAGAEFALKRTGHVESPRDSIDRKNVNAHQPRTSMKSKSGPLDHPQAERRELGFIAAYHSGRIPITKQEDRPDHDQTYWSPSNTLTEMTSQKSLQNSFTTLSKAKQTKLPASNVLLASHESPSYMSNTESSKAKARSQSEPKQRPKKWRPKQKSRRSTSLEGVDIAFEVQQQENQYPWFMKLYRSAKQVNK
ncbi:hypothetical protein ACH5RR_023158 [Cinchona calisaya]|uniref:DUF4005 domain-containing protein n=1 Tax=Cinchona calisaya TaxID=153742 RepID=A0ABD2Z9V5_9GENT